MPLKALSAAHADCAFRQVRPRASAGTSLRANAAVDDGRLAGTLDLDGGIHPHGAGAADLADDGVGAAQRILAGAPGCAGRPLAIDELSTPTLTTSWSSAQSRPSAAVAASRNCLKSACDPESVSHDCIPSADGMHGHRANSRQRRSHLLMASLSFSTVRSPWKSASSLQIGAPVADAEAAVDDLDGQFAVRGGAAVGDAAVVFQVLDQALRAHDIAGHAVAEEHEVVAARLGAKVGIEGQQAVDAAGRRAEVLGDDLGGFKRDPAEVLVDLLQCGEDQFLRFLEIAVVKMRKHAADFIEIDRLCRRLQPRGSRPAWAHRSVDDRRDLFQSYPRTKKSLRKHLGSRSLTASIWLLVIPVNA